MIEPIVTALPNRSVLSKVWTVNEWGRLHEIILGSPRGAFLPSMKDVSQRNFDRVGEFEIKPPAPGPMLEWAIEETLEDLNGLEQVLKSFGVVVHRADHLDSAQPARSPSWNADQESTINIRDMTLIHGDLVIDAPSPTRGRCFESFAVRELLDAYLYTGGKGWYISPPRPRLLDQTYDLTRSQGINETEPLFDAANCVRLGNDIIIDVNNTANKLAATWLQQALDAYYGSGRVRIHPAEFSPDHIDVVIVPLCLGQAMYNPRYVRPDQLPVCLKDWQLIEAPEMIPQPYHSGTPKASNWIGLNLLVVDGAEKTVIVEERQIPLIHKLEQHGFQPIPVRWRHGRTWGGAFHCVTLDVHRDGELA